MTDNVQIRISDKERMQKAATDMLAYPIDIGSQGESKFTIFNIFEYSKGGVNQVESKKHLGSIILPIPPELNNTDSLNYEEFSAPILNTPNAIVTAKDISSKLTAIGGATAVIGGALIGKFPGGDNLINQASALSGASINPQNTNIFKSPSAREHRYSFKMVAKSEKESIAIRQIINKFRYHAYPTVGASELLYFAPDLFTISFKVGKDSSDSRDSFLFHPLPSALVALSVSYNGASSPVFFQNSSAPVEVTMQLIFKEMELDNKSKLAERYNINTGGGGRQYSESGT